QREETRLGRVVAAVQVLAPGADDCLQLLGVRRVGLRSGGRLRRAATAREEEGGAGNNEPAMHDLTLRDFVTALEPAEVVNAAGSDITDLAYDTRTVQPGALFFCLRGTHDDGHALAPAAAAAGAAAFVVEEPVGVDLPQLV